jgi:hypothetical protein
MSDLTGFVCGPGRGRPADGQVSIHLYRCPWCLGHGRWEEGEDRCHSCGGSGTTNDPADGLDLWTKHPPGVEPLSTRAEPLPRPPAVMRAPCLDCAYRPGSPEEEIRPGPDTPFWCHHGMTRVDSPTGTGYLSAAYHGPHPLGAMLCAGWWAQATGQPLPDEAFRDPGAPKAQP